MGCDKSWGGDGTSDSEPSSMGEPNGEPNWVGGDCVGRNRGSLDHEGVSSSGV